MKRVAVLFFLAHFSNTILGFVGEKLIANTTIYTQKVGFDREVTKAYRNLWDRRFLPCGDGVVTGTELCDDYNTINGDGCSSTCGVVETGYECPNPGLPCVELCGDGIDLGTYQCDDGNPFSNDGCSNVCTLEPTGFTCVAKPFPTVCTEICGDGVSYGNYACDDGNTANSDGCSSTCTVEAGFCCDKESCDTICGDGLRGDGSQNCDDENVIWGDGCDHRCAAQTGFTCTNTFPTTCTEQCDGLDFYFLACEDGNAVAGDGCSNCAVELSFQCHEGDPLNKDVCKEICGDGLDYFKYHCDDGNYNSGDGCSVLCLPETGYQCNGGTNTNPDTCPEICGDGLNFGWYECDDGNLINGDGCDDKCVVEQYWRCYDGNPTRKDTCEEKCGDGVDFLINACEDSNVLEWDGCNKYCNIEEGWVCSGGGLTASDVCVETPGDGCRVGVEECDDSNLVNGDGCSSTMLIETGYNCTGGNLITSKDDFCTVNNVTSPNTCDCLTTARDICTEICGDGLDVGVWECDDGNNRDYDGCNEYCFIEPGWTCSGGSNISASVCIMDPRPYVDYLYVNADNTEVVVVFDQAMILYSGWKKEDFNLYLTGYYEPYEISWSLRDSDILKTIGNNTFIFDVNIKDQMAGYMHERVHVQFLNDEFCRSESTTLKLLNWTVSTYTHQHASQRDDQCFVQYSTYAFWGSFGIMVCVLIFYCYKYMLSMTPLWMIISSLQIIHLYCNMDLYIPTCLLKFYMNIGKLVFLELPSMRSALTPEAKDGLSRRFNDFGWDSPAFLANAICVILALIFLVPLLPIHCIRKRNIQNERVIEILRRYWDQCLVVLLLLTYSRLMFSCVINFTDLSIDKNDIHYASSFLTIYCTMTLAMVLFFFIYLGIHTYHRTKSDRISLELGTQRPEMAEGAMDYSLPATRIMVKFLEDIDIRKAPAPFHYALYLIRVIIWSCVLVYLRYEEVISLIILTCSNTVYLLWMMYVRPYRTNLNNRIGIFVEMCTLLITLCIFPYIRAWPPHDIFIDFAKYQLAIIWIMLLMVPVFLMADHFWKVVIAKQGYYNKPHRTIFETKKPRKLMRTNIPDTAPVPEAEGEGEGDQEPAEDQKPQEQPKPDKSEKSEYTEDEGEESEEDAESEMSQSQTTEGDGRGPNQPRRESMLEESKEEPTVLYEKPDRDDGIDMNIISADVENANTAADFGGMYGKTPRQY